MLVKKSMNIYNPPRLNKNLQELIDGAVMDKFTILQG